MHQSDISDVFIKCLCDCNVRILVLSNNIFVGGSRSNTLSNSKSIHSSGNSKVLVIICCFPVQTSVNVT